eukprot:CAMPEP_0185253828 /NCGR_PEP_ID=MMETSP1359-20130426/2408_1 /TAXON_ID=552665 /ORGANISM="Bigelowiella longifila, Strain CCMP242" /LENGTH=222 /DNA_ID=CAMNT_0027836257 /DNA_START=14 /DNA_END=682 /DNA_ORIENTATION=+
MASSGPSTQAKIRLTKEYKRIKKENVENIEAKPLYSNILEWHYVVTGPKGTPYEGGIYHGKLKFPSNYPFGPPSIYMLTPSGRFQINKKLCLSMSDFHPESWNPLWSVSSILKGLLSFMLEETPTYGSIKTTEMQKRAFARTSLAFNCRSKTFKTLFPHYAQLYEERKAENPEEAAADAAAVLSTVKSLNSSGNQVNTSNLEYVTISVVVLMLAGLMSLLYV